MGKSDFLMLFCQAALAAATALVARRFRRASPISMRGVEPEVVDTDGPQLQFAMYAECLGRCCSNMGDLFMKVMRPDLR